MRCWRPGGKAPGKRHCVRGRYARPLGPLPVGAAHCEAADNRLEEPRGLP